MKKFGVVGVGYLGRFHGQKYALLKDRCELVGVFDQSFERAQVVATELGAKAFAKVDELIAAVDAVNVVCSTKGHFDVAFRALEMGKDVFVEKPITHSVETAVKLVEFAKKQNKILQVGHIERFNPAFQEALKKFSGSRFVQADRIAPFNTRGSDVSVVYDLMIHDVDLVLSMVNSPVKSIKSLGARVLTDQVDMARAFIEFESGAFAEITTSRVAETPVRRIQAFNKNSYLDIDLGAVKYRLATKTEDHGPQNPKMPAESVQLQKGDALLEEIKSFIDCVEKRQQPIVDGTSALKALQVCETIEKQMIFNS